jgi:transposase-like protein
MIDMSPVNQSLSPTGLSSGAMDDGIGLATSAHRVKLPAPGTQRWVVRRKAAVVDAVRSGQLSVDDACRTYSLSPEELLSWQRLIERHGTRGLRTTRLKDYRIEILNQNKG